MTALRTAAVLPVRGHARLLDGCLEALRAQHLPVDDLVVVDDSPEASLGDLDGVRIVRSHGRGPYAARNLGWRSSDADVVLFLDARSRPRPSWSERLVAEFQDDTVALAGSEVDVLPGESLGARASHEQQFFRLRNYLANPFFLPYLPTCNLAVRRSDLDAVGGFSEVRSGGDADLCWKVLSDRECRLAAVQEVLMDWVPRDKARDYLEQNYRYGRSNHQLRLDWRPRGAAQADPKPLLPLIKSGVWLGAHVLTARISGRDDDLARYLSWSAGLAFDVGFRRAHSEWRHDTPTSPPVPVDGALERAPGQAR
ncbi:glycosyltransferase [Kineococcus sp. DHX-1]|uniref:glycosyltransferase n=1 Tax=Kineococcus sp. DHX-1 TaxID=3349638 RepID=UPI0036D23D03